MARRIIHREFVQMQVSIEGERFTDTATMMTAGPSTSPAEADGRGRIIIEFGRYTPDDAPWGGAEPRFTLTLDEAKAMRAKLDACIRASDG